jgi:transposase InsO family protein
LREQYGWGGVKLAVLLAGEGVRVTARTIDRIIAREGWTRADAAPAPALRRFVHATPNALWQMDAKGAYPVQPTGRCHALSVLDDHSRFAVGLTALARLDTCSVQRALTASFEHYGVPQALLMDHGVPWWSASGTGGLTRLAVFLLRQQIRLVFGAVRHPQTQGKVERFHRTLAEHLRWRGVPQTLAGFDEALATFRTEYNDVRPHVALRLDPPARHFQPSGRAYQPQPRRWEYPQGSEVRAVTAAGLIAWHGASYFVSEALAGEEVACVPHAHRLLIRYREMYVREVHPRTQRSVPLLQAVHRLPAATADTDPETGTEELDVLPMS